jgi:5-methylcytosine-specific restriction enzyme B
MMMLNEKVKQRIQDQYQTMRSDGTLYPQSQLDDFYENFQQRFNPQMLQRLDGETLLEMMHDHGNRDSLVYWLEYKNDDEFPAIFGSIAGGSALKFRIFRRKETGNWEAGDERNYPKPIPMDEALAIARENREQLVQGAQVLSELPYPATQQQYDILQNEMEKVAPDIQHLGWAHKYWSLLYPQKLDDYHNVDYQRFHLTKLLQPIPLKGERYYLAWWFTQIAQELEMPLNHLTNIMNQVHGGSPYQYWRIGTTEGEKGVSHWQNMRDGGYVAIGWSELGDVSHFKKGTDVENHFKERLAHQYSNPSLLTRKAREVRRFTNVGSYSNFVSVNDVVLAMSGETVLGIGQVTGQYEYIEGDAFPHRRAVEWLSLSEWQLPDTEGLRTTCYRLRKSIQNHIAIEQHILHDDLSESGNVASNTTSKRDDTYTLAPLHPNIKQIRDMLHRKMQVIFYGPPGTGKTYWAQKSVRELAARDIYHRAYTDLADNQRNTINTHYTRMCTFHPAYGYEDFMEGYRPALTRQGEMAFEQRSGIFKSLCNDAQKEPNCSFYLIIDEINRGDIPRIFGELITLLENNKRGEMVRLPLSGEMFVVPDNVYVIGTMNTADRSIALLDTALRRRFGFKEFMPDTKLLQEIKIRNIPLDAWLDSLNRKIVNLIGRDARNLQIGHAYFMTDNGVINDFISFSRVLQEDIIPLLEEYCYEDYQLLENILGSGLIDVERQRIKTNVFTDETDLLQAILQIDPDLTRSTRVVESQAQTEEDDDVDSEDDIE